MTGEGALAGVRVLDLSSLVPGPLATSMLAEAGADVVRIERPGLGDEMRAYLPRLGGASANYALLNRGKRAYAADLKDPAELARVLEIAELADVVVEQFRPGVADRRGLGYSQVQAVNPAVVYCSITGYGHQGPYAHRAGHDLTYLAESGLLNVVWSRSGRPALPPTVLADIAGGAYPAVVNILLALRLRDRTGEGCHLDVSMTHNLQVLSYGYIATHQAGKGWPVPGREMLTGGSPRYQLYRTADGRYVAVAALEQRFWARLVQLLELPPQHLDDSGREREVFAAVAARIAAQPADHWRAVFDGEDVCCAIVATFEEAAEAGLVDLDGPDRVVDGDVDVGALHSPVDRAVRRPVGALGYPSLGPVPESDEVRSEDDALIEATGS